MFNLFQKYGSQSNSGILRTTCLPDVRLPSMVKEPDLLNYLNSFTVNSSVDLVNVSEKLSTAIKSIPSAPTKSDANSILEEIQKTFVESVIQNRGLLPSDYKYFGVNDNKKNLLNFVQHNPFFTCAIEYNSNGTFSINSLQGGGEELTLFSKLLLTLSEVYPRVNATFAWTADGELSIVDMKEVHADDADDIYNQNLTGNKSEQELAGDLLFLLLYVAQCIHALIHIFHYINVVAMAQASEKYPSIKAWSLPYLPNISSKYVEVYELLLPPSGSGVLNGGGPMLWKTGEGKKVNSILREVLCEWGSYKSAQEFTEKFLFKHFPPEKIEHCGLLVQFRKHVALLSGYATDLSAVFCEDEEKQYKEANAEIELILSHCGRDVSQISDIPTWTELMGVTGLLHGCTMSYTRCFVSSEILSRFNPESISYSEEEANYVNTNLLTITGEMDDRHVFGSGLSVIMAPERKTFVGLLVGFIAWFFDASYSDRATVATETLNPLAKSVLIRYDALSTAVKEEYFKSVCSGDQERFKTEGWILSDYFPDGIDGKQLTLATYF